VSIDSYLKGELKMFHLVRISIRFNRVLKNRGGRFLTVYRQGDKLNGKVLSTNPFYAKIQRASDGQVFRVKNWSVRFVCADHLIHLKTESV
jgi:hypothetical protein